MKTKVKAVYVGQRRYSDSTLMGAFLVEGEKNLTFFKKVKFGEIGRLYYLIKEGENLTTPIYPEPVDENMTVEETREVKGWIALECKDKNLSRRIRLQKKASRNEDLQRMVNQLKRFCKDMTYFETKEVIEFLIEEVTKK
jgi:hypothetical protein